jgi:stage III sporulation protein AD
MNISIIHISILAIIAVIAAVLIRKHQPELSMLICLGMCVLLLFYITQAFQEIYSFFESVAGTLQLEYIGVLVKLIGIAYICEFSSGLCRDAGYQSISGQIETVGRIAMLAISLPIMKAIIETVNGFLS